MPSVAVGAIGSGVLSAVTGSRAQSRAQSSQDRALASQEALANRQMQLAEEQYQRYLDLYGPIEEQAAQEAMRPVDYRALAGQAEGVVGREFDAQREQLGRQMARYGVSPASQRGMAAQQDVSLAEAAARAEAANRARATNEQMRQARIENVLNYGKGMPMQAQQGMAAAGAAQRGIAGAYGDRAADIGRRTAGTVGSIASLYGYGREQNWWGTPATTNQQWALPDYSGMSYNPVTSNPEGFAGSMMFAEGGEVPSPNMSAIGVADTVPARLSEGEYVIPADVVRRKGTEFFDRLIEKSTPQQTPMPQDTMPAMAMGGAVQGYACGGKVKR